MKTKGKDSSSEGLYPEKLVLIKSFETSREKDDTSSFHMLSDDAEKKVLNKIDKSDHFTLRGNCEFALGIVTGANKALLSPVKKDGYEEIIKGSEIDKYNLADHYSKGGCTWMAISNAFSTYIGNMENGAEVFKEKM